MLAALILGGNSKTNYSNRHDDNEHEGDIDYEGACLRCERPDGRQLVRRGAIPRAGPTILPSIQEVGGVKDQPSAHWIGAETVPPEYPPNPQHERGASYHRTYHEIGVDGVIP